MAAKIWYSFYEGTSEEDHIDFYEVENLAWTAVLEKNWKTIAEEIEGYIENHQQELKPYFNESLVSKKRSWKIFTFKIWNWTVRKNCAACPKTTDILKQIPHLTAASVSILEPGVTIKPHRGDTNAIMRSHLGLQVPYSLPDCGFRVGYKDVSWENGKVLVFNDAARHTAWNHTDKRRVVLIIDVMRPEFVHKKFWICGMVLTNLVLQFLEQKIGFFKYFPKFLKSGLRYFLASLMSIVLKIQAVIFKG